MSPRKRLAKADRAANRTESRSKLPLGAMNAGAPGFVGPTLASPRSSPPTGPKLAT